MRIFRRKGIALMLTLLVMTLVLIMLGAFIGINRSQFSLVTASRDREVIERASRTVYDYCFYRLEDNKTWGAGVFRESFQDRDVEDTMSVTQVQGTTRIVGETTIDKVTYDVEILNNIDGSGTRKGVPAGSCRLNMDFSRGSQSVRREVLLNTAPLYDSSAVASKGINITANELSLSSTDPSRNMIRSKGGIQAPSVNQIKLRPAPNAAEKGVLWAGDGIKLGNTNITGNAGARQEAMRATGGRFLDKSKTHYDIHDLTKDELKVAKIPATLDRGIYVFTRSDVKYTNDAGLPQKATVLALERRAYTIIDGNPQAGDVLEMWYYGGELPLNNLGPAKEYVTTDGETDGAIAHRVMTPKFQLNEGDDLIQANLTRRSLDISANVDVRVNGNFGLRSEVEGSTPTLSFKDYKDDGQYERGSLSAEGDIIIGGNIEGSGKLLARDSVTLYPNKVKVESDVESDLSIYAGNNVNISPPENWNYRETVSFKGLVYAKNNVNIDITNSATTQALNIEGAIVARDGSVNIDAHTVSLKYNPDYLDSIVKEMPDNRVHLERAVWIP